MPEKDRRGGTPGEVKPAQIPLLEDVVGPPAPEPKPRRRRREDYALDLDPDPPRTHDLFPVDEDATPAAPPKKPRQLRWPSSSRKTPGRQDSPAESTPEPPEQDGVKAARQQLRVQADRVVDDLVQEYSGEIIRRLRQELTALLDQLDKDSDPQK